MSAIKVNVTFGYAVPVCATIEVDATGQEVISLNVDATLDSTDRRVILVEIAEVN